MRETKSARLTRMHDEYDILRQVIPAPACALHFSNPLELLIATVLSAQTTDKRVNTVTPELFATYPTACDGGRKPGPSRRHHSSAGVLSFENPASHRTGHGTGRTIRRRGAAHDG